MATGRACHVSAPRLGPVMARQFRLVVMRVRKPYTHRFSETVNHGYFIVPFSNLNQHTTENEVCILCPVFVAVPHRSV